jgi:hypothetical protein
MLEIGRYGRRQGQDGLGQPVHRRRTHTVHGGAHVRHREPVRVSVPNLGAHQIPIRQAGVRGRPENQRPIRPALGVEPDAPIGRRFGLKLQVHLYAHRRADGSSGGSNVVRSRTGTIELAFAEMERPTAASRRFTALEFFPGEVHARLMERFQRALQAVLLDQRTDVAVFHASVVQQLAVRVVAARPGGSMKDLEKPVVPSSHPLGDKAARLGGRQRIPCKVPETSRQADQADELRN